MYGLWNDRFSRWATMSDVDRHNPEGTGERLGLPRETYRRTSATHHGRCGKKLLHDLPTTGTAKLLEPDRQNRLPAPGRRGDRSIKRNLRRAISRPGRSPSCSCSATRPTRDVRKMTLTSHRPRTATAADRTARELLVAQLCDLMHLADEQNVLIDEVLEEAEAEFLKQIGEEP